MQINGICCVMRWIHFVSASWNQMVARDARTTLWFLRRGN